MSTPQQFIQLAAVVEGLSVSAYLGAAPAITTKAYLTAAGSIIVTEALHQATHRNVIRDIPMANVFGTPLGLKAVYNIAFTFIKSCPSTTAALPVMAYPSLTIVSGLPTAVGALIDLLPRSEPVGTFFATFISGLDIVPVQTQGIKNGMIMVEVPMNISGQAYVFSTKDMSGSVTDSTILFGPALLK